MEEECILTMVRGTTFRACVQRWQGLARPTFTVFLDSLSFSSSHEHDSEDVAESFSSCVDVAQFDPEEDQGPRRASNVAGRALQLKLIDSLVQAKLPSTNMVQI